MLGQNQFNDSNQDNKKIDGLYGVRNTVSTMKMKILSLFTFRQSITFILVNTMTISENFTLKRKLIENIVYVSPEKYGSHNRS